jgi:hypothetical protein
MVDLGGVAVSCERGTPARSAQPALDTKPRQSVLFHTQASRLSSEDGHSAPPVVSLYKGTSLIRKRYLLGPSSRPVPKILGRSWGGGRFLMSEVPLYRIVGFRCGVVFGVASQVIEPPLLWGYSPA